MKKYFYEEDRRYNIALISCIVMTLLFGAFITLKYRDYFLLGDINLLNNDDVRYLDTAKRLLDEHKLYYYGAETMFIMPGYPLIVALFTKIMPNEYLVRTSIRLFQLILQCGGTYIIYFMTRHMLNKNVAIIAVIINMLYLPNYVASNLILTESSFVFFYITLFYISLIAIKEKKMSLYFIGGILWAITVLIRPNAAAFPAIIFFVWLIEKYTIKEMFKYGTAVVLIFSLVMSPWWIRNFNLSGKFVPLTESSANPKLLGAFIRREMPSFADQIPKNLYFDEFLENNFAAGSNMTEDIQNELANEMIKLGFKNEPLRYSWWFTFGKTSELYREAYYWKPIFKIDPVDVNYMHMFIIALGSLGIITSLRKKEKKTYSLSILLILNIITSLPFITFSRYGYVTMFVFIIFMAYLINQVLFLKNNK